MPKVELNPSVDHLHGHVGRMIYKTWKGKNIEQAKAESPNQPIKGRATGISEKLPGQTPDRWLWGI